MPNAEGRAATKRAPAKKATPAAVTPAAGEEAKPERHMKTPLERAQAVYDKAKLASDKIGARLTAAEAEVTALKAEAEEAKVTLDWAASHPLLVRARKDAEGEGAMVDWDIDNNVPAAESSTRDDDYTEAQVDASSEADDAGAPDAAAEPTDVFEQDEPGEGEPTTPATAPFPFDAPPPVVPAQPEGQPFDFEQARVTHV